MVRKGVRRVFRGSRYWIGAEYEKARWRSVELAEMGHPVYVGRRVRIEHPHRVSLLDNVSLGSDVILDGYGGVVIGKNCVVADNVVIWTSMHNYDSPDLQSLPFDERLWGRPVTIDKHVWIGRGAVLGPGSTLAKERSSELERWSRATSRHSRWSGVTRRSNTRSGGTSIGITN